jgi:hypothetical protein
MLTLIFDYLCYLCCKNFVLREGEGGGGVGENEPGPF